MKYYTFANEQDEDYELITRPPFRMLERVPDVKALVEFDEDGLALLQKFLADNGSAGACVDEKRRIYKISDVGLEQQGRLRPKFLARFIRDMRRRKQWAEDDRALCEGATEAGIIPNGRVPLFFCHKRYIYVKPGRAHPFRCTLRSPKGEDHFPLLIYMHGAGADGTDGLKPLLRCALLIFRARQKYHLLVPQQGLGDVYGDEFSEDLGDVIASIPRVDRARIYITGTSMGGCGAIIECRRHPERYAAAVPAVAALKNLENPANHKNEYCRPLDGAAYDALAKTPMWLAYSQYEKDGNEPLYEALKTRGAQVRRTHIRLRGLFGHVIVPLVFSLTKPWAKWMFSKQKDGI